LGAQAHPEVVQTRGRHIDELLALTTDGYIGRLGYAESLSRQTDAIEDTLGQWATWWRDVLLIQRGNPDGVINLDRRVQLMQQALLFRPEQVEGALSDLMQTLHRIKANVNARLALDVLALRLPKPAVA
jgi:hypothetical protein